MECKELKQIVVSMTVGNGIILRASKRDSLTFVNPTGSRTERISLELSDEAKRAKTAELAASVPMISVKMIMKDKYSYNFGMLCCHCTL